MVNVKILKPVVKGVPEIKQAMEDYNLTNSVKPIYGDGDFTELEAFGLDTSIIALYSSLDNSQCSIDGATGVVEVNKSKLDEIFDSEVLVRDMFAYKIKGDKALLTIGATPTVALTPVDMAIYNKCLSLFSGYIYADGKVYVQDAELDLVWSTTIQDDGYVVDTLVRDRFEHEDNVLYLGFLISKNYEDNATNDLFRKMVASFGVVDFSNFYCTNDTYKRKLQGFELDKAEILSMLKADLEAWMIERGIDKLMSDFDTALKGELQNFVVEYYFI